MATAGGGPVGGFPPIAELRQSDDPDFLAMLDHVVALSFDETAAGTGATIGKYGGATDAASRYRPVLGYEEVLCHIAIRPPEPTEGGARPGWATPATVSFAVAVPADRRWCLDWEDPQRGPTRWFFKGPVKEQPGAHHWTGYVQDQPL